MAKGKPPAHSKVYSKKMRVKAAAAAVAAGASSGEEEEEEEEAGGSEEEVVDPEDDETTDEEEEEEEAEAAAAKPKAKPRAAKPKPAKPKRKGSAFVDDAAEEEEARLAPQREPRCAALRRRRAPRSLARSPVSPALQDAHPKAKRKRNAFVDDEVEVADESDEARAGLLLALRCALTPPCPKGRRVRGRGRRDRRGGGGGAARGEREPHARADERGAGGGQPDDRRGAGGVREGAVRGGCRRCGAAAPRARRAAPAGRAGTSPPSGPPAPADRRLTRARARSYGRERAKEYLEAEEEVDEEANEVDQQARLPDAVRDNKLYLVKVKIGKERETVICLMQKAKTLAESGQLETGGHEGRPFLIKAAAAQDHLKGYIYVEAARKPHVREALHGLRNVYGAVEPRLVPIPEMVASISVAQKASARIAVGSWVRMRAGLYKGDLARVLACAPDDNSAVVRLVPRFDYAALARRGSGDTAAATRRRERDTREALGIAAPDDAAKEKEKEKEKKEKVARPPPRLFSHADAAAAGLSVENKRDKQDVIGEHELLAGAHKLKHGYLLRPVALSSCRPEPTPPFEELERFKDAERAEAGGAAAGGPAGAGAATLAALVGSLGSGGAGGRPVSFAQGDAVIVVAAGDLKNLTGTVEAVLPTGEVRVAPHDADLQATLLSFRATDLAKHFPAGSHVRVTLGRHEGSTGMVLSVTDDVAVLLTDVLREELRVFMRDLVDAKDASGGEAQLGEYALFDLALHGDGVAGVVVHIERDAAVLLTHSGPADRPELRHCRLADLSRRLNPVRHSAQDVNMAPLGRGDSVHVTDGPLAGKSGVVQWVHRGYLFLKSREVIENAGIVCVRSKSVKVAGGAGRAPPVGASAMALASPASALRSPAHPGGGGGGVLAVPRSPRLLPAALGGNLLGPPAGMGAPRMGPPGGGGGFGSFSGGGGKGRAGRDDGLVGMRVKVATGAYKGYVGIVLDATEAVVRLELEANEKTVTINRAHLDARGAEALGARRAEQPAWGATPSRDGAFGRTPVHLGNATPMRDVTMTPGRDVLGFGATPARRNPWEGTPGRDAPSASWGGGAVSGGSGFGAAPQSLVTPGDSLRSGWGAGAAPPLYAAGPTYPAAPPYGTWGGAAVSLSGAGAAATPAHAPTPAYASTPALQAGGGYTPAGSAAGRADGPAIAWLMAGLVVRLRDGKAAAVRSVAPDGRCMLQPLEEGALPMATSAESVAPTVPARNDRVRVIAGQYKGQTGKCTFVGPGEALIRLDGPEEAVTLPFAELCKCLN